MSKLQKIEGLLFDLGGVVIDIDFTRVFGSWASHSQLTAAEIQERFVMDEAYEQHERGQIDASAYFAHLRHVLQIDGSEEDMAAGWNDIYVGEIGETLHDIMLAKEKLPCFAFTNSNPTHQATWNEIYPGVVAAFDRIFVSSDLGLRKPEQAAFEAITEATGISPKAMLFFDDSRENVEGARTAGYQAVHVRGPADVKQALIEIGALTI